MGEQKLPKPLDIKNNHCSCVFQTHEYAITPKLHLNQQVIRDFNCELKTQQWGVELIFTLIM